MDLLPRNEGFFDELEALAGLIARAGEAALGSDVASATAVRSARRESASLTRRLIQALQTSFIPPLDRDDLHQATLRIDDVVASLDWACFCRAQGDAKDASALTALVVSVRACVETVVAAVGKLRVRAEHEQARALCDQLLDLQDRVEESRRAAWPDLVRHGEQALVLHTTALSLVQVAAACRAAADTLQAALFDS